MNESLEEFVSWVRENLIFSLAMFLIGVILVLYALFIGNQIMPGYRLRNDLELRKAAAEEKLAAARDAERQTIESYKTELDAIPDKLSETGNFLVTNAVADRLVNRLFQYADETSVDISNLETKNTPQGDAQNLYAIRQYQLEAIGRFPDLMRFIGHIEEAKMPSYLLENIIFNRVEEQETLTMIISVYTSSYGSDSIVVAEPTPLVEFSIDDLDGSTIVFTEPTVTPEATAAPTPEPTATPAPHIHFVRRGETLFSIAQLYGVTVNDLKAANNIFSDLIYAEQELIIPAAP